MEKVYPLGGVSLVTVRWWYSGWTVLWWVRNPGVVPLFGTFLGLVLVFSLGTVSVTVIFLGTVTVAFHRGVTVLFYWTVTVTFIGR